MVHQALDQGVRHHPVAHQGTRCSPASRCAGAAARNGVPPTVPSVLGPVRRARSTADGAQVSAAESTAPEKQCSSIGHVSTKEYINPF